ncbi:hypothetical protein ACEPAF_5324 [Sanghuangporus sanghuang]
MLVRHAPRIARSFLVLVSPGVVFSPPICFSSDRTLRAALRSSSALHHKASADEGAQGNIPLCVSTCMDGIASDLGCISSENLPCTCRSSTFMSDVQQCFGFSCDEDDQERGEDIVTAQCIAFTSAVVTMSTTTSGSSSTIIDTDSSSSVTPSVTSSETSESSSSSVTTSPSTNVPATTITTTFDIPPITSTIISTLSASSTQDPVLSTETSVSTASTLISSTVTVPPSSSSSASLSVVDTVTSTRFVSPTSTISGATKGHPGFRLEVSLACLAMGFFNSLLF